MEVRIKLDDWKEEHDERKLEYDDVETAYEAGADAEMTVRELSQDAWVHQRVGKMAEQLFDKTGKLEFGEGVYRRFLSRSPLRTYSPENSIGKPIPMGRYKAFPASNGNGLVAAESDAGINAARNYLKTFVIGHIRRQLVLLVAHGEDIGEDVDELVRDIRGVAEELAERVPA